MHRAGACCGPNRHQQKIRPKTKHKKAHQPWHNPTDGCKRRTQGRRDIAKAPGDKPTRMPRFVKRHHQERNRKRQKVIDDTKHQQPRRNIANSTSLGHRRHNHGFKNTHPTRHMAENPHHSGSGINRYKGGKIWDACGQQQIKRQGRHHDIGEIGNQLHN